MGLIVPDVAEQDFMAWILAQFTAQGLHLHLYKNNYTPVDASVLGSFTEADFSGYSAAVPSMGTQAEVANKCQVVDAMPRNFTHNGGGTSNTVYGYYVTKDVGPDLLWAERFSAPVSMAASGDNIQITLKITADSENH